MTVNPRIAVSAVSSWNQDPAEDLAMWRRLGVDHVGLSVTKLARAGWDDGVAGVLAADLRCSSVGTVGYFTLDEPASWSAPQRHIERAQELARRVDADCTIVVSGGAGRLPWDDAAVALGRALTPAIRQRELLDAPPLALENTSSQRPDYGFVHTLRDAADVAGDLGIDLCVEVNSCWGERDLARTFARCAASIRLVQVSDFVLGSSVSPDRAVLGDGDIPFDRIVGALLDAGYLGAFEIELVGPRIEAAGYDEAIARSVEHLDALLSRLGA